MIEIANQLENNIRLIVKYFMLLFAAITFYTSYSGCPLYTFFVHLKKREKEKRSSTKFTQSPNNLKRYSHNYVPRANVLLEFLGRIQIRARSLE